MAGAGARFAQEGYAAAKPLIEVSGIPMILRAAGSLPKMESATFVCRAEHLKEFPLERTLRERFGPRTQVLSSKHLTQGQACTCLLAKDALDREAPLMIGACDNGMVWDEQAFARLISEPEVDCVVWTFRGFPGARRRPEAYGWVRADDQGWISEISVKKAISTHPELDPGVIGSFWFRKADYFIQAAEALVASNQRVNNEFYVDSVIHGLVESGHKARIFDVKRYLCCGTPDDLRTWQYWEGHFKRQGTS